MLRIFILVVVLGSSVAAAPNAKQLAKERVTAAEKVYAGTLAFLKSGRATGESAYAWSVRWLDAELANGRPAKQAFADHQARMTSLEGDVAKAVQAGTASPIDGAAADYFKVEAELWALRGKR